MYNKNSIIKYKLRLSSGTGADFLKSVSEAVLVENSSLLGAISGDDKNGGAIFPN